MGRGDQNDVQIQHPSVSGSHCTIAVEDGSITLNDLGSSNGSYVNGAQVQQAALRLGERF